jgi:hypothetical protein
VVCAGDVVGFGPDSAGVIDELQRRGAHCGLKSNCASTALR